MLNKAIRGLSEEGFDAGMLADASDDEYRTSYEDEQYWDFKEDLLNFTQGRREEIRNFLKSIDYLTPVIFWGVNRIGKTHLLKKEIIPQLEKSKKDYLYIYNFKGGASGKGVLIDICKALIEEESTPEYWEVKKTRSTTDELVHEIKMLSDQRYGGKSIRGGAGHKFILIIDNMERLKKVDIDVLEEIGKKMYICGASAKLLNISNTDVLFRYVNGFNRLSLNRLTDREAQEMTKKTLEYYNLKVDRKVYKTFVKRVIENAHFLPGAIQETIKRFESVGVIKRDVLETIPLFAGGTEYFDAIDVHLFFIGILPMALKFLYRATFEFDLYGMMGMLAVLLIGARVMVKFKG